ncbi:MAG TPA: 2-amino-4-hydroxy-6-hydroxymethyldihydropteridine diphosphokinase [Anaerolineales bacterium]
MGRTREFYLGLGSNIDPEQNIVEALRRLRAYGEVGAVSSVWESQAVGTNGPNFLNLCVEFRAPFDASGLKAVAIGAIESAMGRVRSADKNAPRNIDIDILMEDAAPVNVDRWKHPFVVLPMAELLPNFLHPLSHVPLSEAAVAAEATIWIRRRPDIKLENPREKQS